MSRREPQPATIVAGAAKKPIAAPSNALSQKCRAATDGLVGTFLERLVGEAARSGGHLRIHGSSSLDRMARDLFTELNAAFYESFAEEAEAEAPLAESRSDAFHRLLVGEFASLFTASGGPAFDDDGLSRRVLPGFFTAVKMMLGPEFMTGATRLCSGIIERTDRHADPSARWHAFHASPDSQGVLLDALAAMTPYFREQEKRLGWFVDLVNARLDRPIDTQGENNSETWRLTQAGAARLWEALFAKLTQAGEDELLQDRLIARQGQATADSAIAIAQQLSLSRTPES